MERRVEIVVLMGLDAESEEALKNAFRAAEVLRSRYGINAFVVPVNTWVSDPVKIASMQLPRVVVNNLVVARGRAPEPMEIVDAVLNTEIYAEAKPSEAVPAAIFEDRDVGEAVAVRS